MPRPGIRRGLWRRRLVKAFWILSGAVVLLLLALWLGLQSSGFRLALFSWGGRVLEARTGIVVAAEDVRVELFGPRLEIDGLALAARGSADRPFLGAAHLSAEASWRGLLADAVSIRQIEITGPTLDLSAPLPAGAGPSIEERERPTAPALEIESLRISDGVVVGPPPPLRAEIWAEAWRGEALSLEGSVAGDRILLRELSARLFVESPRRPTLEARLSARGTISTEEIALGELRLEGDGLRLEASGAGRFDGASALESRYEIDLAPGRLFPDLSLGGRAASKGEVSWIPGPEGRLRVNAGVDVADFPTVLLEPWLAFLHEWDLTVDETSLDLVGTLAGEVSLVDPEPGLDDLRADVELVWRGVVEELLSARLRTLEPDPEGAIRIALDAGLLPARPGTRRVEGRLVVDHWRDLPWGGRLLETEITLEEGDLESAWEELGISPRALGGWLPAGSLEATLEAEGSVARPDLALRADWSLAGEKILGLDLSGRPDLTRERDSGLSVAGEVLLLPGWPGARELSARIDLPDWTRPEGAVARELEARLDLPDLESFTREALARLPDAFPERFGGASERDIPSPVLVALLAGRLEGRVEIEGPLARPRLRTEGEWTISDGEVVTWRLAGETMNEPPWLRATDGGDHIEVTGLELSRVEDLLQAAEVEAGPWRPLSGRLSAWAASESAGAAPRWRLEGAADGIVLGELARVDQVRLQATLTDDMITLESLDAGLRSGSGESAEAIGLAASGWLELERPIRRGLFRLELETPALAPEMLSAEAGLTDGYLVLDFSSPGLGGIASMIPLGTLAQTLGRPELFEGLAVAEASGPLEIELETLSLGRLQEVLQNLGPGPASPTRLAGALAGSLRLDPLRPAAATGALALTGLALESEGVRYPVDGDFRLVVGAGVIELPATSLEVRGEGTGVPLELRARADLAPAWKFGDPVSAVVERIDAALGGSIDAAILTPFLGGGVPSGRLSAEAFARGPLDRLVASMEVTGADARILFPVPYPTLIEKPEISARFADDRWDLETGRFRLNGGEVELRLLDLKQGGRKLEASIDGARYRLDRGLIADLSGDLSLRKTVGDRALLSGRITLERGVLRRNIVLEREILRLATERSLVGAGDDLLSTLDLDLDLVTLDGIWIQNNLADLRLDWSLLRIRGTGSEPQIAGRVDIESGGIVTAYGQTVRIDDGSVILSGDPDVPPRLELETTSSLEDPRLGQNQANFWATGLGEQGPGMGGLWESWYGRGQGQASLDEISTGLANYYTNLFAEGLVGGMNRVQLSFQPLPILGETDSQARLTVAYHASPNVTLYTSQNPRQAEGRTEVLDLHGFALRPSVRAQIFHNDAGRGGATLQETILLGGGRRLENVPRVRSIRVDLPSRRARRRLKRALELRKGDPLIDGSELHVEVDAIESLRQRGYPTAAVRVATSEARPMKVDLEIGVVPGTTVRYEFAGEKLPRRTRRTVRSLFNPPESDRGASLREMETEIVRALRSRGHLHPEVDIRLDPDPEADLLSVRIESRGGVVVDPEPPRFPDLDQADQAALAARFPNRLARVELAADLPEAREILLRSLRALGYRGSEIREIELGEGGRMLTVGLDPGQLRRIGAVEVAGMDPALADPVLERLGIVEGLPFRSGVLTRAALALEDDLRESGHLGARVEIELPPLADEDPAAQPIRLVADAGPASRVGPVSMEGLQASRPSWVRRKLGLEEGALLAESDLQTARRRLSRTGVFERISVSAAPVVEEGQAAEVALVVEERPRYMLGFGGRWEEERGLGLVLDAVDRHFLGRGQTFGVRLAYASDDQRLRFFHAMPLPGAKTLELFLEGRDEIDPALGGLETRGVEFWAQLSFSLTPGTDTRVYGVARRRRFRREGLDENLLNPEDNTPLLGWQLLFDTRGGDRGDRPPRRWNLFYGHDLVGFWKGLAGESTGLGLFTQVKLDVPLRSLGTGQISWVQSYRTGWIEAFEGALPFVDRLRAGGEYTVRGYPTDSLGPLSSDGTSLGGELMFVLNQELQLPLTARIAGIAFFDAGNVWLDRTQVDSSLFKSVGLGLRAASPIGPLRLDLAFPLDRRDNDPRYKIYVGFGPTF